MAVSCIYGTCFFPDTEGTINKHPMPFRTHEHIGIPPSRDEEGPGTRRIDSFATHEGASDLPLRRRRHILRGHRQGGSEEERDRYYYHNLPHPIGRADGRCGDHRSGMRGDDRSRYIISSKIIRQGMGHSHPRPPQTLRRYECAR